NPPERLDIVGIRAIARELVGEALGVAHDDAERAFDVVRERRDEIHFDALLVLRRLRANFLAADIGREIAVEDRHAEKKCHAEEEVRRDFNERPSLLKEKAQIDEAHNGEADDDLANRLADGGEEDDEEIKQEEVPWRVAVAINRRRDEHGVRAENEQVEEAMVKDPLRQTRKNDAAREQNSDQAVRHGVACDRALAEKYQIRRGDRNQPLEDDDGVLLVQHAVADKRISSRQQYTLFRVRSGKGFFSAARRPLRRARDSR